MIRNRLLITLLMVIAVIICLGVSALWLVHSHTSRFDRLLDEKDETVLAVNSVIFHSSVLSDYLVPALLDSDKLAALEASPVINQHAAALGAQVEMLEDRFMGDGETPVLPQLGALVEAHLADIEAAISGAVPVPERALLGDRIASRTRAIARTARELVTTNAARTTAQRDVLAKQSRHTLIYLGLLVLTAAGVLFAIYRQFHSLALAPLADLTDSVREVGRRNFELSLPVRSEDEIGQLSEAYNEMAAELRHLHRETDEHIVALNALNRALLTAFPFAIIVVDREGSFVQVNPEAEQLLGGLGTPGRLPAKLHKLFEEVVATGDDYLPGAPDQALLFRLDEREFYYLPRIIALPPVEDLSDCWGIVLSDVSRFRWLDDLKMSALATVSHELRTPLTSIRMVLHLLLEQKIGPLNETQNEMIASGSKDCERLIDTLNDLLDVSRLNSGAGHLNIEAVAPGDLLAEQPASLKEKARAKQVEIEVDTNGSLPLVLADGPRIRQVLTNFLSNAIRFSPPESVVAVKARKAGAEFVRFMVSDRG
ncbi:MAG: HAMP domain-containing protein, partial [Akkermansiaceae bacterium]|nr:HAMP domain-containing protein [Akkermansiaceae bacterium]